MEKVFVLLGKIFVSLLIAGGLVVGGVYLDRIYFNKISGTAMISPAVSNPVAKTPTPTMTQVPQTHFAVSAGGLLPFKAYTLSAITGWILSKTQNNTTDQIILTKDGYEMSILQAALGGGGCMFPADPQQEMSVQLTEPHEILLQDGTLLKRGKTISPTPTQSSYTICQKGTNGTFGTLTDFGVITYITQLNPDTDMLSQMDAMVGSLHK